MNPCIGWHGECDMYGDMHGCKLPDGHHGRHVCACATLAPPLRQRQRAPVAACGTDSGYYRHRRNGETACEPCRMAHTVASANWQARNRGAVNWSRAQSREEAA